MLSQVGVGLILRSRAQMMRMNFRCAIALSIYLELMNNGSAVDALNLAKFAR
jgi:hypothetical protein